MKKIFTLLLLFFTVCSFTTVAQSNITCNAEFSYLTTGNTVKFTPVTIGSQYIHIWDFGDGSTIWNDSSLSYTYTKHGTYTVTDTIKQIDPIAGVICTNVFTRVITIANDLPCNLKASIRLEPNTAGLLKFIQVSSGTAAIDSVKWNFGDGRTSKELTPNHSFFKDSTYTVCLLIYSGNCKADTCINLTVPVIYKWSPLPFTWSLPDSTMPNKITFNGGPYTLGNLVETRTWNFGDGTPLVKETEPVIHIYSTPGTYSVCLTREWRGWDGPSIVWGAVEYRADTCVAITVGNPTTTCNIKAAYTFKRDSVQTNKVYFTNTSTTTGTNIQSFKWSFGDGTYSDNPNPTHVFPNSGVYTVCLQVKKDTLSTCSDDTCMYVQVQTPTSCTLIVNYTSKADTLTPNKIYFTNLSTPALAATDSVSWTFGDGTSSQSHDATVAHTYSLPGTYKVCLFIKKQSSVTTAGCAKEKCDTVVVAGQPTTCNLVANFNWQTDSSTGKVYFINASTPFTSLDTIRWDFGDNTPRSYDVNPVHTYATAGTYNVCIRVKKAGGSNCIKEICKTIVISPINTCNLTVNFSSKADSLSPGKIYFTNLSIPVLAATDSVSWTFGDGSSSKSHDATVTHTYTTSGAYHVCLLIKKQSANTTPCVKEYCTTVAVYVKDSCNLTTGFNWSIDTFQVNKVQFYNTSTGAADSIRWNFGDGTAPSYDVNPQHIYTAPGTYNVCIRIQKINTPGTVPCVKELCKTITVQPFCNLQAYFIAQPDSIVATPLVYKFTNATGGGNSSIDSAFWDFGDGSLGSTWNADHKYNAPGTYTVCLTVKRRATSATGNCMDKFCKTIVVQGIDSCNFYIDFTSRVDSLNKKKLYFTNLSQAPTTSAVLWTFGDGKTGTSWNPDHIYTAAGSYNVCLKITTSNNCVKSICKIITVDSVTACNLTPKFTWKLDSSNNKKVYFTNTTGASGAIVSWSFGDGNSGTSLNPDHIYAQPGTYYVCLNVQLNNTCSKTYCDSIIIPVPVTDDCKSMSLFSFEKSITDAQRYIFKPVTANTTVQYTWTFGDSTGSKTVTAEHRYNPGTYTACLTAYKNANCASTTCKTITVQAATSACQSLNLTYNYRRDSIASANRIYFETNCDTAFTKFVWTAVDLRSTTTVAPYVFSTLKNAVQNFADSGYYRVCVTASTASGNCSKQYCTEVHIEKSLRPEKIMAYPNPVRTDVYVNIDLLAQLPIHVQVYSLQNVLVNQKQQAGTVGRNTIGFHVQSLPAGFYTIKLAYGNDIKYVKFEKF